MCRPTEEAESSDETDDGAAHAAGRLGLVDWCSCEGCRIMPTVEESLCCRENEPAVSKMESMQQPSCITLSERFGTLCLNQDVLTLALMTIHDTLRNGQLENNIQNRQAIFRNKPSSLCIARRQCLCLYYFVRSICIFCVFIMVVVDCTVREGLGFLWLGLVLEISNRLVYLANCSYRSEHVQ